MSTSHPLVSVITPTYNHEQYIEACILSVLSQTYGHWEMIVIDDGSTDATAEIASRYAAKDSRITLIRQQNKGIYRIGETYNHALSLSSGDYIAILEGDDLWEPAKLEKQLSAFEANPEAIVCFGLTWIIGADGSEKFGQLPQTGTAEDVYYQNDPPGSILNILLFEDNIGAQTILIRKAALDKTGGFVQGYLSVDLVTLLELSLLGNFVFLPEVLGSYRNYAGQVTKLYPALSREKFYESVRNFLSEHRDEKGLQYFIRGAELDIHHSRQISIAYSRSGRYNLIRRQFKEARQDYLRSLDRNCLRQPAWVVRSVTGLVFSYLHLDVEWLAKMLGKKHYKP